MVEKLFAVSEVDNILRNYHCFKSLCGNGEVSGLAEKMNFIDNSIAVLPEELRVVVVGSYIDKVKISDLAKNMLYSRQTIYNKQKKAKNMIFLSYNVKFKSKLTHF